MILQPSRDLLNKLLGSVGDMSLKRRASKILEGLDLKAGDKVLDVGCGDGFFLYSISALPIELTLVGFDNDKRILTIARKNLANRKLRLVYGDAAAMPFTENSFNQAIMTEVLEHVKNERKALAEVYRILKPNGILVLTVPSYNFPFLWDPLNWTLQNIFGTHISGTNFFAGIWARHLRLYKRENLQELINNAGFKIEEMEELTTRCLPFNHYLVNVVARLLYDVKPTSATLDSLSKFKNVKKQLLIRLAFFLVNTFDKLNDIFPGKKGLNIYVKARKS